MCLATGPDYSGQIRSLKQSLTVLKEFDGLKRTSFSKLCDHADLIYAILDSFKGINPFVTSMSQSDSQLSYESPDIPPS